MHSTPFGAMPEAILQPMTDEQRALHVWFADAHTTTAVLCPTERCGAFLAALAADSVGTLRIALIHGRKEHPGLYWRVSAFKKKPRDLHRYDRMAQVPLSGRPGRVMLACPNCAGVSRIVVHRPPRPPSPSKDSKKPTPGGA